MRCIAVFVTFRQMPAIIHNSEQESPLTHRQHLGLFLSGQGNRNPLNEISRKKDEDSRILSFRTFWRKEHHYLLSMVKNTQ